MKRSGRPSTLRMTTRSTAAWAEMAVSARSRSRLKSAPLGLLREGQGVKPFNVPFTTLLLRGDGGVGDGLGGLQDASAGLAGWFIMGVRHDLLDQFCGAGGEFRGRDVVQRATDFVHVPDDFGARRRLGDGFEEADLTLHATGVLESDLRVFGFLVPVGITAECGDEIGRASC